MQVTTVAQASADVLTITRLTPGDVYKRVHTASYSAEPTLRFGVVTDVMNNGSDAAVTAIEFTTDYGAIGPQVRVIHALRDEAIFPATPDEVALHFAEVAEGAAKKVTDAQAALEKAQREEHMILKVMARAEAQDLTAPATSTEPLALVAPHEEDD